MECGYQLPEEAKFCIKCGKATQMEEESKDSGLGKSSLPENWQSNHRKVSEAFPDAPWIPSFLSKQTSWVGEENFPDAINEIALMSFSGRFIPTGRADSVLLFTPGYVALLGKKKMMSSQLDIVIPSKNIIKIQIGTQSHLFRGGSVAFQGNFWHVSVITERARTGEDTRPANNYAQARSGLPLLYKYFTNGQADFFIEAGRTAFEAEETEKKLLELFSYLANFYEVTLDGGHIESSSGSNTQFGVGILYDF